MHIHMCIHAICLQPLSTADIAASKHLHQKTAPLKGGLWVEVDGQDQGPIPEQDAAARLGPLGLSCRSLIATPLLVDSTLKRDLTVY